MNWQMIVELALREGLPVALAIAEKWQSGNAPTSADFAELRGFARQTAKDRIVFLLAAQGIAPDSPRAQELLKLVA